MSDEKKKIKHYNAAHVWGRIAENPETKMSNEGKGPLFLRLKLNCYSPRLGNVIAYANLWGKEDIDELIKAHLQDPRRIYKFNGFVSQYVEGKNRYTNFSFYSWIPAPDAEPRVAFILVGEITGIEGDKLSLLLNRPKSGESTVTVEERLELFAPSSEISKKVDVGDTVKIKGYLRSKDGEDDFGENSSPVRPYIDDIKVLEGDFAPF